jgi:hypothetical protein
LIIAIITTSAAVPCTGVLIAARLLCERSAGDLLRMPGSLRYLPEKVLT